MAFKKFRNMKVCEQSGYKYKATPTITLKGQWFGRFILTINNQKFFGNTNN